MAISCLRCSSGLLSVGYPSCPDCGTSSPAPGVAGTPPSPLSDELLKRLRKVTSGEFELVGEVGHGGMARVFLAHEIALERQVAIKVLSPLFNDYPEIVRRFQHEARTAGQLSHPNIVSVYAVYQGDGLSFFTMPFIAGASLREILRGNGPLELEEALGYLRQAAAGLAYAHDHGVVHRDVKPENMILEQSTGRLVLTDFGLAKALGAESLTLPGDVIGTPHYMAPEQCEGEDEVDGRTDQYSLALVAYEMLAGDHPFASGGLRELLMKQLTENPEPLHERRLEVPLHVSEAIQRALAKDPEERFPSVDMFTRALTGDVEPRRVRNIRQEPGAESAETAAHTVWMRDSLLRLHKRRRLRQWVGRASVGVAGTLAFYLTLAGLTGGFLGIPEGGALDSGWPVRGPRLVFAEVDGLVSGDQADLVGPPLSALEDDASADASVDVGRRSAARLRAAGLLKPYSSGADASATHGGLAGASELKDNGHSTVDAKPASPTSVNRAERRRNGGRGASASPRSLLEDYRLALQREDLEEIGRSVYGGQVPKRDREMLSMIIENADELQVDMSVGEFRSQGERTTVDVDFPMRYLLTKTRRAQSFTLKLRMSFENGPDGWRLASAERR